MLNRLIAAAIGIVLIMIALAIGGFVTATAPAVLAGIIGAIVIAFLALLRGR